MKERDYEVGSKIVVSTVDTREQGRMQDLVRF